VSSKWAIFGKRTKKKKASPLELILGTKSQSKLQAKLSWDHVDRGEAKALGLVLAPLCPALGFLVLEHPANTALTRFVGLVVLDGHVRGVHAVLLALAVDVHVVEAEVRALLSGGGKILDGSLAVFQELQYLHDTVQRTLVLTPLVAHGHAVALRWNPALFSRQLVRTKFKVGHVFLDVVGLVVAVLVLLQLLAEDGEDFRRPLGDGETAVGAVLLWLLRGRLHCL